MPLSEPGPERNAPERHGHETEDGGGKQQRARRPVGDGGLHDRAQEARTVAKHRELRAAHPFGVAHGDFDQRELALQQDARAHGRREVEAVGQGIQVREGRPAQHPHSARRVLHGPACEESEQRREDEVSQRSDPGHLAVLAHARAQHEIGVLALEGEAEVREEARVAGAVRVEEAEEVSRGEGEAALDGGAVAPVPGEAQHRHLGLAARDLLGPVGRPVAHDEDLHVVDAASFADLLPRREATREGVAEGCLFVQGRDHDGEAAQPSGAYRSDRSCAPTRGASAYRSGATVRDPTNSSCGPRTWGRLR